MVVISGLMTEGLSSPADCQWTTATSPPVLRGNEFPSAIERSVKVILDGPHRWPRLDRRYSRTGS
jgi:hypothetical protein